MTMSQYIPLNLAYTTFDPVGGADAALAPIIFLHGSTASKEMWFDLPQKIANKTKRKAYAIDSRNHGETEWTDDFNFDINADDLLHFMDTISAPKAVLVGHSMGGITSIKTALKSPKRVEMMFVEDMFVKKLSQEILDVVVTYAGLFKEAVRHVPANCPEEDVARLIFKFATEKLPEISRLIPTSEEDLARFKFPLTKDAEGRYQVKTNFDVLIKALKNADTLMSEPKGLYEGPSYFIYGTISPFKVNEDEENIKKFFPKAELIPVENGHHSLHVQFPETFLDTVVKNILKH